MESLTLQPIRYVIIRENEVFCNLVFSSQATFYQKLSLPKGVPNSKRYGLELPIGLDLAAHAIAGAGIAIQTQLGREIACLIGPAGRQNARASF